MSNNSVAGSTQAKNNKIQSFLEALRNSQLRGSETLGQDSNPSSTLELRQNKEVERRRAESFHEARQQEWNQLYSAKNKQIEGRLSDIREQLRQLAKQVKRLDSNLYKAVESPIIHPGTYQENFFVHIQKVIQLFRLETQEANSWLEMYNGRSLKKGVYWNMAGTKGNSFTQSNERAVATSIG